jgi:hypothetical protein
MASVYDPREGRCLVAVWRDGQWQCYKGVLEEMELQVEAPDSILFSDPNSIYTRQGGSELSHLHLSMRPIEFREAEGIQFLPDCIADGWWMEDGDPEEDWRADQMTADLHLMVTRSYHTGQLVTFEGVEGFEVPSDRVSLSGGVFGGP